MIAIRRRLRVIWAVLRGRPVIYRWHFAGPVTHGDNTGGLVVESRFENEALRSKGAIGGTVPHLQR